MAPPPVISPPVPHLVIPVAHDFNCEWCWAGVQQAEQLKAEFGVAFEWRGYEQHPESDPWPDTPKRELPDRPKTPSRLELHLRLHDLEIPDIERPRKVRTFLAHEAVEFAKARGGDVDALVRALYRAYWEEGRDIGDPEVVADVARPFVQDPEALPEALAERRFAGLTVPFDAEAFKSGVFNVPTFWIGGERYAEQRYDVLQAAVAEALGRPPRPEVYEALGYPPAPDGRPYILVNMVATIDGKILSGERDEPVVDLGSAEDHRLMKRIERSVDAVVLGAQTLRAAKRSWNPQAPIRVVVTRSGTLDFDACFFSGRALVACPESASVEVPPGVEVIRAGAHEVDPDLLVRRLHGLGVRRLLLLGGSVLNAQFFERQLVDELFVTIAPKIKLGRDVPTIADGEPLPRERIQNYRIVEQHRIGEEIFLRYRRIRP